MQPRGLAPLVLLLLAAADCASVAEADAGADASNAPPSPPPEPPLHHLSHRHRRPPPPPGPPPRPPPPPYAPPRPPLPPAPRNARLVVVVPTFSGHHEWVRAGGDTWRKTTRAVIVSNGTWGSVERRMPTPEGVNADYEAWCALFLGFPPPPSLTLPACCQTKSTRHTEHNTTAHNTKHNPQVGVPRPVHRRQPGPYPGRTRAPRGPVGGCGEAGEQVFRRGIRLAAAR